jgi:hypothetical protein
MASGNGVSEITFKQWIDSVWFRGMARGAIMLTTAMFAIFLAVWGVVAGNTSAQVEANSKQMKLILTTQGSTTNSLEEFKAQTTADLTLVKGQINDLRIQTGVIRNILQTMQQKQDVASNALPVRPLP